MRRFLLINSIIVIVVMLTACSIIDKPESYTNASASSARNNSKNTKAVTFEASLAEVNIKTDKGESEAFSYEINYPVISKLQNTASQDEINEKIKKQVYGFMTNLKTISESQAKSEFFIPYKVKANCEIKTVDENIISMVSCFIQDTGGAHPIYAMIPYNIDVKTGKILLLEDIFISESSYKDKINKEITNQIKKANSEKVYFTEKDLRFSSISPLQQYFIQDGQLNIQFDIYEIAPYSTGAPSFIIPNELIIDQLKGNYKPLFINN